MTRRTDTATREPWIRVFAAEMRGDAKIAMLGLDEQLLLVHAWDVAKNDSPTFGELRAVDGTPFTPKLFAELVPRAGAALARRFFHNVVAYELATKTADGAIFFPELAKRQGFDPTNAERQARHRSGKRNGKSNGPSNGTEVREEDGPPPPPAERGEMDQDPGPPKRARGRRSAGTSPRQVRRSQAAQEKQQRQVDKAIATYAAVLAEDGEGEARDWLESVHSTDVVELVLRRYSAEKSAKISA